MRAKNLDALRAIAVILVLVSHFYPKILPNGYLGVDIFFLISGFIITKNLVSGNYARLRDFYRKRALKILPPLFITYTLILLIAALSGSKIWLPHLYHVLTFTLNQKYLQISQGYEVENLINSTPLSHLWSLSVEEQFYLVWPILMLTLVKSKKKLLVVPFILSLICYLWGITEFNAENNYYSTLGRFWELILGALIAVNYEKIGRLKKFKIWKYIPLFSLIIIISLAYFYPYNSQNHLLTVLITFFAIFLLIEDKNIVHESKMLNYIGLRSYSLYLYHLPIGYFILNQYQFKGILPLTILITVLSSMLSYRFIEVKILNLKISTKKIVIIFTSIALLLTLLTSFSINKNTKIEVSKYNTNSKIQKSIDRFCESTNVKCDIVIATYNANSSWWHCKADVKNSGLHLVDYCPIYQPKKPNYKVLLIGDSVPKSFIMGLYQPAIDNNYALYSSISLGCGWFKTDNNDKYFQDEKSKACNKEMDQSYAFIAKIKPDLIIISNNPQSRYMQTINQELSGVEKKIMIQNLETAIKKLSTYSSKLLLVNPPTALEAPNCEHPRFATDECDTFLTDPKIVENLAELNKEQYLNLSKTYPNLINFYDSVPETCLPSALDCRWETKEGITRSSRIHLTSWLSIVFGQKLNEVILETLNQI